MTQTQHPIVVVASEVRALLKGVAGANPTFLTTAGEGDRPM